jgi:hypothetical protein
MIAEIFRPVSAASILATGDEQEAGILGIFVFLRPGMWDDESTEPRGVSAVCSCSCLDFLSSQNLLLKC